MEVKVALSSATTLLLGLVCVALGGLLLARLVWTADPGRVELEELTEGPSYYEEEEEERGMAAEDGSYDQEFSRLLTDYNSDGFVDECTLDTCHTRRAKSCQEIKELGLPSDYYSISTHNQSSSPSTVRVFCNVTNTGGWARAVLLNMSDHTHSCPDEWREITSPKRTCGRTHDNVDDGGANGAGCSSATFDTHDQEYRRVCGRVVGYQYCNTMAFWSYFHNEEDMTIDDPFVDGVTISHGSSPRQHIWTFAAALHENYDGRDAICKCTRGNYDHNSYRRVRVPPWVGTSYFCDTGTTTQPPATTELCSQVVESVFYSNNSLWDGRGCGINSDCCQFHDPPWFCKELPEATRDNLEVRICGSSYPSFGDTPVELVELYIN